MLARTIIFGLIALSVALAIFGWNAFSRHHSQAHADRIFRIGSISVESPWAPELPPILANQVVFMTIVNEGERPDRLVGATSEVSSRVEIHDHIKDEAGMLSMRQVESIELLPGKPVRLEPGGLHLMLMGLARPIEKDTQFKARLEFASGASLEIDVPVGKAHEGDPSHSRH